jgi:all-trans-retinol 13,14-reductase
MKDDRDAFDAIVIGSGIGGLACAAALARTGHTAVVLEQHYVPGGLTQTFHRSGFRWDVGVHYLGDMGPQGEARRVLDWLSGGAIRFSSMGAVYDIIRFPGDFAVEFVRPEAALRRELEEKFPASATEVGAFFTALAAADRAARAVFAQRVMPGLLAKAHRLWHRNKVRRWWGRSCAEVLNELVSDPKLRAVLLAQRADYGGTTAPSMSFGVHATVMRHYFNGAYYPVGGAKSFADALVPAIERGGGKLKLRARVQQLLVENGIVVGVRLDNASEFHAPRVFSDVGARNTVGLLPAQMQDSQWAKEVLSLAPSVCHIGLYLGLEGDIRANGASPANHWFHSSWDVDAGLWRDPLNESSAPGLFVSFPSLKDPAHNPGSKQRHTAELVAMTSWDVFAPWQNSTRLQRPEEYTALKSAIERNMLAQFAVYFPALAPMVVAHELSTPLTTSSFIGSQQGAI